MEASQIPSEAPAVGDLEYMQAVEAELPQGEGETETRLRVDILLQRIAEAQSEMDTVAEFTRRRVEMVSEHGRSELDKLRRRVAYLESLIRVRLPGSGRGMQSHFGKRSLTLPHGTVGYRASSESVAILDASKALAWAKSKGLETTVKETVGKAHLHEYVERTGEIPDAEECGWKLEPAGERFYVTPKGEA